MRTAAIVPLKEPAFAKGRLSGFLPPEHRASLALDMLGRVLDALTHSGVIDIVAVVSPDPASLDLPPGVVGLRQTLDGLNNALEQGRAWAIEQGAGALLVVFADLPHLSPDDVREMVSLGQTNGTMVLAPDRHGTGTNAMLANPPSLARFAFGPNSYARHRALHSEINATIKTYISPGTSVDIDTPDDMALLEDHLKTMQCP